MSYPPDQPGGPYPPRDPRDPREPEEPRDPRDAPREPSDYPPRESRESEYPPPPGEEDNRPRAYHARGPSSGSNTLPSISQSMPPYDQQYGPPNGYGPPGQGYQYPPPQGYAGDGRGYAPYGGPPPMPFQQTAPRQRTAIACRYCRRRKIRCSGFDQSPDGRCTNCQRFQQDCIFTPVSSQTQAFVPAHAVYPQMRNMGVGADGRPQMMYAQGQYPPGQQLYGAHGQPLGTVQPPQQQQQQPQQQGSRPSQYGEYNPAAPSPTGSYSSFTEERSEPSRKRPQAEPHAAILPPPVPGQAGPSNQQGQPPYRDENRRQPAGDEYRLAPVTPAPGAAPISNDSPNSNSNASPGLSLRPPPQEGAASASRTPPPRTSPSDRDRADPMSLGNIMGGSAAAGPDKDMLRRLDRKSQQPPPSQ